MRYRRLLLPALLTVAAGALLAPALHRHAPALRRHAPVTLPPVIVPPLTEVTAREHFHHEHPGEPPYHVRIARAAELFHQTRPMGTFVFNPPSPVHNACSDYCACCVDHGLGVGARFERQSDRHLLGDRDDLFEDYWWQPGFRLAPGDEVDVRHSPYYPPNPAACWHVGLVGTDGHVYDFSKLKRWPTPRYGRQSFAEFTRNSHGEHEIMIRRLRWEYRYGAWPIPKP